MKTKIKTTLEMRSFNAAVEFLDHLSDGATEHYTVEQLTEYVYEIERLRLIGRANASGLLADLEFGMEVKSV